MDGLPAKAVDQQVVAKINRRTGADLTVVGRAVDGELGGAIYVQWPDGRPAVVTRCLQSPAQARRTADVLGYVRARGLPVPRHDLVVELGDDVFYVQERLAGAPPRRLTVPVVNAMVAINDRFADALVARPDVPVRQLFLRQSGDPYPRHETLREHGARSRRVLGEILRIGRLEAHEMSGADLVHVDFTAANVLFDEGGDAVGVVDWNLGAYRGDRLFALVKTRFDREWFVRSPASDPTENAAVAHLDAILADRIAPTTLRMYWAHWMLYQLYWVIRSGPAEAVDWHLEMAESRLA